MTPNPQPFLDMFKKLGEDLKVPAMDLEPILAHHRKNLEALAASGKAAAEGATAAYAETFADSALLSAAPSSPSKEVASAGYSCMWKNLCSCAPSL